MSEKTYVWVTDNIEKTYFETLVVSEDSELYIPHRWGDDFMVYWSNDGVEVAFPRRFSTIEEAKHYAEQVASVMYLGEPFDASMTIPDSFCPHKRDGIPCHLGRDHEGWHQHTTESGMRLQWLGVRMKMTRIPSEAKKDN